MKRKSIIDRNELDRRTEEYVNQHKPNVLKFFLRDRKNWTADQQDEWRNARSNMYYRMRKENKERTKDFWLEQMDNGIFEVFFKKYGLTTWAGNVSFIDNGSLILTKYLKDIVLPALKKEMNIKGVTLNHKRVSGLTVDLFNWENAEVLDEEVSK